jgi:hypothetical protein
VHTFLLRHVYSATRKSYRISKSGAMFVTFLVSALAHELVMVIVTKKIRSVSVPGDFHILSDFFKNVSLHTSGPPISFWVVRQFVEKLYLSSSFKFL